MVDSFLRRDQVSTKPGQLQSGFAVVVVEKPAQPLVQQNDARGGFWNALDRPVAKG
jgi:hypothetical protein